MEVEQEKHDPASENHRLDPGWWVRRGALCEVLVSVCVCVLFFLYQVSYILFALQDEKISKKNRTQPCKTHYAFIQL